MLRTVALRRARRFTTMPGRSLAPVWGLALLASLAGCFVPEGRHTIRFELVREPTGEVVTESNSYFFWGLAPTVRVDVLRKCPYGAVAIVDGSPDRRIRPWFPTFGLWSRRSTTYYCRRPPASEAAS